MKVAVPEWQGRVSPVFDVAEHVLLVDSDDENGGSRRVESLGSTALHERVRRLAELGVDVLVCGAISAPLSTLLASQGIKVIPLICGDVDEIVRAFCEGSFEEEQFAMPGCCRKGRFARHRHRRRGGGLTTEEGQ